MQFCLPKIFGATPPESPQSGPLKLIVLIAQAGVIVFFYISRSLSEKCFDILWGYHRPQGAQNEPQKNKF